MATFPSITPTYGAEKSSRPNIRVAQFGDGYQQRVTFGLNQDPKQWSLTWNISETDADTIEAFLDARAADAASFDWTPVDDDNTYKWICLEWNKSIPYANRATVTAIFQQVFEP